MKWIDIAVEGQPKVSKENPYPVHMVRLVCVNHPSKWERIEAGMLRLCGRDPNRPNWVTADSKTTPLENDSWVVTHYLSHSLDQIEGWPKP